MGMWALTRHRAVQGRRQGGQWAADHLDATNSIVLMLTIQVYKNAVFDPLKSENDPLPPPYHGGGSQTFYSCGAIVKERQNRIVEFHAKKLDHWGPIRFTMLYVCTSDPEIVAICVKDKAKST